MIVYNFYKFLNFIPQYIVSTIIALLVYFYIGWRSPKLPLFFKLTRRVNESFFKSPFYGNGRSVTEFFSLDDISGNGYYTIRRKNYSFKPLFFSILYSYLSGSFRPDLQKFRTSYSRNIDLNYNRAYFDVYRIFFSVIIWAGLLFLITPFRDIYIFLPHLNSTGNTIVAVILSVSIFEAIISLLYFISGISRKTILLTEAGIFSIFSLSLLAPSMTWFNVYSISGKVIIYLTLLALFLAIGIIIPQLRRRRTIYRTSFAFTLIAYLFILLVVIINILRLVGF